MIPVAGLVAVLVFAISLERSGVAPVASKAFETVRKAALLVKDQTTTEREREAAMRSASLSSLGSFLSIGLRGIFSLVISFLPLFVFHLAGLADLRSVTEWLAEWPTIILISAVFAFYLFVRRRS